MRGGKEEGGKDERREGGGKEEGGARWRRSELTD